MNEFVDDNTTEKMTEPYDSDSDDEIVELVDYEDSVIDWFKNDFELCREMIMDCTAEYKESGDKIDLKLLLQNLRRLVKARGYQSFKTIGLTETQIDKAIQDENNHNIDIINKMLETLNIEERLI